MLNSTNGAEDCCSRSKVRILVRLVALQFFHAYTARVILLHKRIPLQPECGACDGVSSYYGLEDSRIVDLHLRCLITCRQVRIRTTKPVKHDTRDVVLMASVCMIERYMLFPQGSPSQNPRFTNATNYFRVCPLDLQDLDYDNYDKLSSW